MAAGYRRGAVLMRSAVLGAAFAATAAVCSASGAMAYPVSFSASGTFAPSRSDFGTFTSKGGHFSVSGTASTPFDFSGSLSLDLDGLPRASGTGFVQASFGRFNGTDILSLALDGNLSEVFDLTLIVKNGPARAGSYDLSKLSFSDFYIAGISYFPISGSLSSEFYTPTLAKFSVTGTATLTGDVSTVPLPASLPAFGLALAALAIATRSRALCSLELF